MVLLNNTFNLNILNETCEKYSCWIFNFNLWKKLDNGPGPFSPLMKYSYGEDEWKTTYSTDQKQLYNPRKFSNLT